MSLPDIFRHRRRELLFIGLAACAGTGASLFRNRHKTEHQPRQPDGRLRSITIAWPSPTTTHVLQIARQNGFFAANNLHIITPEHISSATDAITALQTGKADAAVIPILTWLPALHDGLPAKIAEGTDAGTFRLLVRKQNGINRIGNIPGTTIAITGKDSADKLFLAALLRRKGIDPFNAITWVTLAPEQIPEALSSGQIQGVIAQDPVAWRLLTDKNTKLTELTGSDSGHLISRINPALGFSNAFLEKDPDGASALIETLKNTCDWIAKHKQQLPTLLAPSYPDMDDAQLADMLAHEAPPVCLTGKALRHQVAQYADELKLIGYLPDDVSSSQIARSFCVDDDDH
ncbi:MAG: ABC transporter substrate-binding protein [Acetobacter sp.]|nr:ABC transporter substrate-binding protein [Acetobacter sp.]MCH4062283.1 ABC transporter substrate-binding protein [Acetobacter sp.]MCH4088870.1 ABC transporter substrate-binding protein [Acetobacter sp.]MCI1292773.1 ABC transporter substrate-binding protein [Acetobacter sp.]MCI1319126.1 ABC transporter substrate-binding protein [Acetobacter sp.]